MEIRKVRKLGVIAASAALLLSMVAPTAAIAGKAPSILFVSCSLGSASVSNVPGGTYRVSYHQPGLIYTNAYKSTNFASSAGFYTGYDVLADAYSKNGSLLRSGIATCY